MSNPSPQAKTTPAKRKQGRNNGRSAGQKAYASENDVGMFESAQQRRAPQTPDKTGSRTPGLQQTHTGSKQRSKTKSKGKGNQTSPEAYQQNQSTPPPQQRRASMKANAVPAFAGATFHASPAPSALPLPSFLAKTSTESPLGRNVARPSPPGTDTEAPTLSSSAPKSHESPLDFMFRAHRQEKQREYRDYSTHDYQDYNHRSPAHGPAGLRPSTDPRPTTRSSAGIGRDELDGSHGLPIGPAFSTPYQERINAARAPRQAAPAHGSNAFTASNPPQDDPSEALKKFLFGGNAQLNPIQSPPVAMPPQPQHQAYTSGMHSEARPSNIQAMENDLRRILKLDLGTDTSSFNKQDYVPN